MSSLPNLSKLMSYGSPTETGIAPDSSVDTKSKQFATSFI